MRSGWETRRSCELPAATDDDANKRVHFAFITIADAAGSLLAQPFSLDGYDDDVRAVRRST